jgi:hypothetical protein
MNYIHLALFIGIAICLLIISWIPRQKEGFDDAGELMFNKQQCPLISSQIKGYKDLIDEARKENQFSTISTYNRMIATLETKAKEMGCTGNESAAKVPLALPSTMSSSDIEDTKESPAVIDLTQVPSTASVS